MVQCINIGVGGVMFPPGTARRTTEAMIPATTVIIVSSSPFIGCCC
jgi:CTP synthase (UTP-ammonia lyase)